MIKLTVHIMIIKESNKSWFYLKCNEFDKINGDLIKSSIFLSFLRPLVCGLRINFMDATGTYTKLSVRIVHVRANTQLQTNLCRKTISLWPVLLDFISVALFALQFMFSMLTIMRGALMLNGTRPSQMCINRWTQQKSARMSNIFALVIATHV